MFVAKNGSFLEKEFLSKELSGRKVELDEVIEPSLQLDDSTTQKDFSVAPTPNEEVANDDDHETSDQVTTEPRRLTRNHTAPGWYDNPILEVMLLDNDEPTSYGEAMMGRDPSWTLFLRAKPTLCGQNRPRGGLYSKFSPLGSTYK